METTGTTTTPHYISTDHLTGSNVVTNSSGAQEELMDYYPFGAIRLDEKAGGFSEQRKFTGYEYDVDTGLNYAGARYQNPSLGRFISQDPVFWDFDESYLTDPQQWNSYSYARNNPLVYVDTTGKEAELVVRPVFVSKHIPLIGDKKFNTHGAHGAIKITAEPGADLSQYGEGPIYTIGGYKNGNRLQAAINDPRDLNFPESGYLTTYPLNPPDGMSVAEYDQKLLESGANLAGQDLGRYLFTGQPISTQANSGNTVAQVVINAGGTFPQIPNAYMDPTALFNVLPLTSIYAPLGLGNPIGTPSYSQRINSAVNKFIGSLGKVAAEAQKYTPSSITATALERFIDTEF